MATPNSGAARSFDILANGKYNVQLGHGLKDTNTRDASLSSVAFNHKPSQTSSKRSTSMRSTETDPNSYNLSIYDEHDDQSSKTEYRGRRLAGTETYILMLNEDQQSFTLEALNQHYEFNMVSAPWEEDTTKLQEQYKQIGMDEETNRAVGETSSENEEELFGEASEEADPDNPFDFRHYLKLRPVASIESRNPSHAGTPVLPAATKTAVAPRPQQGSARSKMILIPKPRAKPRRKQTPVLRLNRRSDSPKENPAASSSEPSGTEDDGFVLELSEQKRPLKRRPDPVGTNSDGRPVSLRAAATSGRPSIVTTTKSPAPQDIGSGYEEDNESADADEDEEADEADDDVDELELPGPAVESGEHPAPRRYSTWDNDAEALLEASLEEILAAQDEEEEVEQAIAPEVEVRKVLTRKREDSDSESEEE